MTDITPTERIILNEHLHLIESIAQLHIALERGLTEIEIRLQRLYEGYDLMNNTFEEMTRLLSIIADREY